jgi:hypothetical protein
LTFEFLMEIAPWNSEKQKSGDMVVTARCCDEHPAKIAFHSGAPDGPVADLS